MVDHAVAEAYYVISDCFNVLCMKNIAFSSFPR